MLTAKNVVAADRAAGHHERMTDRPGTGLIGREDSLGLLFGALERARGGTPTVVVVAGETGVGKTALVTEFLARADAAALAGTCVPVAGEPLPYAALTQALRLAGGTGVVRQEIARSPELSRLLPSGPTEEPANQTSPTSDGASSRLRLFQSVLRLLARMGAAEPVVHVVEDVHWADQATLDLLAFLATNLTDERAMLLLTYRTEAVADTDPLAGWLAELGRLHATESVRLDRLDRDQTRELVTALIGDTPKPELLEATLERSAGNPLFVQQLVLAGGEPGPLPATLHDLLRSRIAHLPADTRALLRAAAVIGRVASVPLLARAIGEPLSEVEDRLRPAIAAHVVEVRADERIGFHHPAFREVVYAELLPGERARLHRGAAEALGAEPGTIPQVVGEVARHWHRAGDLPRALESSLLAGEASMRMYAFADAQTNYLRALELLEQVPSDLDRVDLNTRAAECSILVGDSASAVRLVESALAEVDDPPARAALFERLGSFHYLAGNGDASDKAFRQALALLPPGETSTLAARVYAGLGLLSAAWSRLDVAEEACAHALRISRAVGARREEGMTLNALGLMAAARGDADGGVALLRESLVIAREVENPNDVGAAYINLSHMLGIAGRLDEGVTLCHEGIVELNRMGQDRQNGSFLLCNTSDALIKAGRLTEAGELIAEALGRQPRGIMAAPVLLFAARLTLAQGDLRAAWERCEQARLVIESENAPIGWLREVIETAAEVELWAGRPEPALELVTDGLEAIAGTDEAVFGTALVALGLRALADAAAVRRDPRSRASRATRRRELLALRDDIQKQAGEAMLPESRALGLLCEAERARLDEEPAAELWALVAEAWAGIGRPLPAAYAGWRRAEALLGDGVSATSTKALRDVHTAALGIGAARLVDELESMATWYRVDLPQPVERTDSADAAESAAEAADEAAFEAYGLTTREREVLAALAAGHSNKEIADAMFISVKTASVHVSNILRKLDVSGRQDAARIAHRLGVTG